ncbi:MAG: aminomethyltransferase family protein [Haloferacaceae archaeon]
MTVAGEFHADLGATFEERGGRRVVRDYGRPESAHRAVRNGVGVVEMGYGVIVIEGDDRVEFLDNAVSNRVPDADGEGAYALLLDPQGRIETDMYVYNADERLLVFVPPSETESLVRDWRGKVFVQDVVIEDRTPSYGVFGVHGPKATEKVASVLTGATPPEDPLSFVRGSVGDAGVTVVASDAPTGEEGYEVVCLGRDGPEVADALLSLGMNAAPFGYATWDSLTLEAGTPLFETELSGRIPNVCGVRNALDFEKGCYVGQEVVSKVENRGRPSQHLVGLASESLLDPGAAVLGGDASAGEVTRAVESPSREEPIALAFVDAGVDAEAFTVRSDGEDVAAERVELPFVEGSGRSARLPSYVERGE